MENFTEWMSFSVKKPEAERLVLIKISSFYEHNDDFDPREFLFLGYYYEPNCVYLTIRIDKNLEADGLCWKAHKDHDLEDMLWYKG
jgi:hypothetical protein